VRERGIKWARRHPAIASGALVALGAAGVLTILLAQSTARGRRLEQIAAAEAAHAQFAAFMADYRNARVRLYTRLTEPDQLRIGVTYARKALGYFPGWDQPDWPQPANFGDLSESDRD